MSSTVGITLPGDCRPVRPPDQIPRPLAFTSRSHHDKTNNGTIIASQVNFPVGTNMLHVGRKTLDLLQYHFHSPSEHAFDGQRYHMEAHLVHSKADRDSSQTPRIFLFSQRRQGQRRSVTTFRIGGANLQQTTWPAACKKSLLSLSRASVDCRVNTPYLLLRERECVSTEVLGKRCSLQALRPSLSGRTTLVPRW